MSRSNKDPERSAALENLAEEEEESIIQESEPRMFQGPENDLLPAAGNSVRARKASTVAVQRIRESHSGMLPANLAKIRRRSSVHRPPVQLNREMYHTPSFEESDGKMKEMDEDDESPVEQKQLTVAIRTPMIEDLPVVESSEDETVVLRDSVSVGTEDGDETEMETFRFGGPLTVSDMKEEFGGLFTLKTLKRKLPILEWLPKYSKADLFGDLVAGLTVGLTVVPQCLAYAVIADIKLEYGLNSAYIGCFIYALLGTSKDVTVGPTAIVSLLTGAFIRRDAGEPGEWAILLCFFVGVFQLLMGVLRLGFFINFISAPVVSGFTQAAVVVIILGQVKNMMGVKFGAPTDNLPQTLAGYWSKIPVLK